MKVPPTRRRYHATAPRDDDGGDFSSDEDEDGAFAKEDADAELAPLVHQTSGVVLAGDLKRPPSSPRTIAASLTMFGRLWRLSTVKLCFAYIVGISIRCLLVYITWEHFKDTKLAEIMEDTEVFGLLSLSAMLFPIVTMWMAMSHRKELIAAVADMVAAAQTLDTIGVSPDYSDEVRRPDGPESSVVSDTHIVAVTILRRDNVHDTGKSPRAFRSLVEDQLRSRMATAFKSATVDVKALAVGPLATYNAAVTRMEMVHLGTYSTAISSHNAALFFAYFSLMPAHFVNKFGLHSIYISVGFGFLFMGPLVVAQLIQNPFSGNANDVMNEDVWACNVVEYQAARGIFRRVKAWIIQCFSIAM